MNHYCYLDSGVVIKAEDYDHPLAEWEIELEAAKRMRDMLNQYIEDPETYSDDVIILTESED